MFCVDLCVPGIVLFILSLLPVLSGLGHICPVGEGLEQTTDVLILRPGSTDGQLLLTLDYTPEDTRVEILKCEGMQKNSSALVTAYTELQSDQSHFRMITTVKH